MENPIKMDDLGVPPFLETHKCSADPTWLILLMKNIHAPVGMTTIPSFAFFSTLQRVHGFFQILPHSSTNQFDMSIDVRCLVETCFSLRRTCCWKALWQLCHRRWGGWIIRTGIGYWSPKVWLTAGVLNFTRFFLWLYASQIEAFQPSTVRRVTPWKINMEPINYPFRKENHLPNLHDYVPC